MELKWTFYIRKMVGLVTDTGIKIDDLYKDFGIGHTGLCTQCSLNQLMHNIACQNKHIQVSPSKWTFVTHTPANLINILMFSFNSHVLKNVNTCHHDDPRGHSC